MHIAFLTPEYPHEKVSHAGGIGTSVKNLAIALVEAQVQVSLFIYGQQTDEVFIEDCITFHLIKAKKYSFFTWYYYRKHIQDYINQRIKLDSIDLVEAVDWCGITAFMNLDSQLIIRFHGSDTYFCHLEKRKQKLKNYWFERLAVKNAQGYIAPTNFAGKLSAKLLGVNTQKIKIIHYGLELDKFQNSLPQEFEEGLILYIGTIIRKKGVLELPEIFCKVRLKYPKAHLVLIGEDTSDLKTGSTSTWRLLKERFNSDDEQFVQYLGKIPYHEVKNYIQKAHICVFPTFAETMGMVTIESMALQKPVVNSDLGWAQELIDDGINGFLVYPKNHDEYAEKILSLLHNNEMRNKICINARRKVEQDFDIGSLVWNNIQFYKKISNEKSYKKNN